jgi:hypothetical protein
MIGETSVSCPHCWEEITLALDLSVPFQDYIEDCPVCCHPMRVVVSAVDGELSGIEVERADG